MSTTRGASAVNLIRSGVGRGKLDIKGKTRNIGGGRTAPLTRLLWEQREEDGTINPWSLLFVVLCGAEHLIN